MATVDVSWWDASQTAAIQEGQGGWATIFVQTGRLADYSKWYGKQRMQTLHIILTVLEMMRPLNEYRVMQVVGVDETKRTYKQHIISKQGNPIQKT